MKTMIISIIAVLASVAVSGQSLTLTVKDVEHVEGTLYVAIYSSKENFMKKPLFGFRVAVEDRTMTIPCKGIPAGTYAISLFQDENGNGKLDTGSFGRPLEKFDSAMMPRLSWELFRMKSVVSNLNEILRWSFI